MKVKKSPFKTKRPSVAKGDSRTNNGDASEGVSANIRVAVRVRPENERELGGTFRNVIEVIDDRMLVFDPENNGDDFFYHGKKVGRRDLNKKAARDKNLHLTQYLVQILQIKTYLNTPLKISLT